MPSALAGSMTAHRWLSAWSLCAVLALAGCGGGDGGVAPPPPDQTVRFDPPAGSIRLAASESIVFTVRDSEGNAIEAAFVVDGDTVATGSEFEYVPVRLGAVEVIARVSMSGTAYSATWALDVRDDDVLPTPTVFELTGEPGPQPGTVSVLWERPPPSLIAVPIAYYEIAAHTASFDEEQFASHLITTVADNPSVLRQRLTLQGLQERTLHTVGVRVVDNVGRRSFTRYVESDVTGQFAWSGTVYGFSQNNGTVTRGLGGVVVDIGGLRVATGGDGRFSLSGIADLSAVPLRLIEQTGATYYEIDTGPLAPEDRTFSMLMLPRGLVPLPGADPDAYPNLEVERLRFLKIMRQIDIGTVSTTFPTWQQYPVQIHVHPYVQDASQIEITPGVFGDRVDYALAFERAVAAWNQAAGTTLLEIVPLATPLTANDLPSTTGAYYTPDIDSGSTSILGQVINIRPEQGPLYVVSPVLQVIRLRREFNFQRVADWVIAHELGHVLGIAHSPSPTHLMFAQTGSVPEGIAGPTREEALIVRLLRDLSELAPETRSNWWKVPQ